MALKPGTQIGPYEITTPLGAGGMGEVYRATDTKLKREVAIKVLPDEVAGDSERLARFEREAHVLASLNHPHIASIYGLEESGGVPCLVLELVEGQTLAEVIAAGSAALERRLEIARQITSALEAAHEKGIIHRDLKPANIKITPEGQVKVLDFGLAKAMAPEPTSDSDRSQSPTLTAQATKAGVILGTAAYMSPEQAKGMPVDNRTDVFAFGCVLYEMLTGTRGFEGDTITETLASVLKSEPDWDALPAGTTLVIRRLLRRCLMKDPARRVQAIGDARIEIEEVLSGSDEIVGGVERSARRGWVRHLSLGLAATALGLAAGFFLRGAPTSRTPSGLSTRLSIVLPPNARLAPASSIPLAWPRPLLAISPEGRFLSWVALVDGTRQLYLRDMTTGEVSPVAGTEDALCPFFSPNEEWIGFFAEGKLKKVSVAGGRPIPLAEAPTPWGGSWASDGTIYFTASWWTGLSRVSSTGGAVERVTTDAATSMDALPELLPGERGVLYNGAWGGIWLHVFEEGESRKILDRGSQPRYVPPGYVVYGDRGKLGAVPFDLEQLKVTGPPVTVLDDLRTGQLIGAAAQFAVSREGTLVYAAGLDMSNGSPVWIDRQGETESLGLPRAAYRDFELSPDGKLLAVPIDDGVNVDIHLYDFERQQLTRFTLGGKNRHPLWTPDAENLIFNAETGDLTGLLWQPADRSGPARKLLDEPMVEEGAAWSISPDGKLLAVGVRDASIWIVPLEEKLNNPDKPVRPELFLQRAFMPAFSPHGGWIAYASDESGDFEVYVRPYPGPGAAKKVSRGGGEDASWSPDGRELFYSYGTQWYVVDVTYEPVFDVSSPRPLFKGPFINLPGYSYDVSADGQRFLVVENPEMEKVQAELTVLTNLTDLLEEQLARDQ